MQTNVGLFQTETSLLNCFFFNWTELFITAIDKIIILPPKNILLHSITRNIVTEHPKEDW